MVADMLQLQGPAGDLLRWRRHLSTRREAAASDEGRQIQVAHLQGRVRSISARTAKRHMTGATAVTSTTGTPTLHMLLLLCSLVEAASNRQIDADRHMHELTFTGASGVAGHCVAASAAGAIEPCGIPAPRSRSRAPDACTARASVTQVRHAHE